MRSCPDSDHLGPLTAMAHHSTTSIPNNSMHYSIGFSGYLAAVLQIYTVTARQTHLKSYILQSCCVLLQYECMWLPSR